MSTKLIVGLGNPGKKYDNTRHNIGFMVVEHFAKQNNLKFKKKFDGLITEYKTNDISFILLMPQTFMNLSGKSVKKVVDFYKIDINDILVVNDDLDIYYNTMKLKKNSSSGGHNGLKDIINQLKTKDFLRLKMGIKNDYKRDVKDFVLSPFSKEEQKTLNLFIDVACDVIDDFTFRNTSPTDLMNKYN